MATLRGKDPKKPKTYYRPLLESEIRVAQMNSKSAQGAARYLNVSYNTYKRYAQLYGLHEQHLNQSGKGIQRKRRRGSAGLDDILEGKHPHYKKTKLKERLIRAGYMAEECAMCGYNRKRDFDGRSPLVLVCLDGDDLNLKLDNLELRCYNCFAGSQKYLTNEGLKSFEDTVNTKQMVLAGDGKWREADIICFGKQLLQKVILIPSTEKYGRTKTNIRYEVICTPDHTWYTNNRGKITNLRQNDIISFNEVVDIKFNLEAWIRGFGFGDGTIGSMNRAQIRLYGEKDIKWLSYFQEYGNCSISYSPSYKGDPLIMFHKGYMTDWKRLPSTKNPYYLASWLEGYLAADAMKIKPNGYRLASQNNDAINFVKEIAPLAGYIITGYHVSSIIETNLGTRKAPLQLLTLQKKGVFKVEKIVPIDNCAEKVYCAVEPVTHQFTLEHGILTGNCVYLTTGITSEKNFVFEPTNHKGLMTPETYDKDVVDSGLSMEEIEDLQNELMLDD